MLTEKDYCDYETCVALKELGYKVSTSAYYIPNDTTLYFVSNPFRGGYAIDCFYSHNSLREGVVTSNYIDAPTMWEAQKWLRENHNLHVEVSYNPILSWYVYRVWEHQDEIAEGEAFPSYEDALSTAIYMATEFLKEESNGI